MLIACPGCDRRYQIADAAIGGAGRSVRCSRCGTAWIAEAVEAPVSAGSPTMPAPRAEPAVLHGLPPEVNSGVDHNLHLPPAILPPGLGGPLAGLDSQHSKSAMGAMATPADGMPTLEARVEPAPRRPPAKARRLPRVGWRLPRGSGVAAGLAALAAALVFRTGVVEAFPATARLYAQVGLPVNLRGVEIRGLQARPNEEGVLHVEGRLAAVTAKAAPLARLRIGIESATGEELVSVLIPPPMPVLAPGEDAAFSTELAGLPSAAHTVTVRFEDRHARASVPKAIEPHAGAEPAHAESQTGQSDVSASPVSEPPVSESHSVESKP